MKVLVVDSGGRGHALAWKIAQSPRLTGLFVAPGNGGTKLMGCSNNVDLKVGDVDGLLRFALQEKIDLTVVGSEDALAAGIVDTFQGNGLQIFGPSRLATQIEASKSFAKEVMDHASVPTASCRIFADYDCAFAYVRGHGAPIVVKADGLALGKGAVVCFTVEQAKVALHEIMVKRIHGSAGARVVIEEYLEGPEISIHALCDGKNSVLCPSSQDHKPAFDGDKGDNTGGMGTIAPVPWVSAGDMLGVANRIVAPTLAELARVNAPFAGCLYPGLKMTTSGPKVLEFNARPGDPETQVYMRLLRTDLLDILEACANGTLDQCHVEWNPGFAACVIMASGGYPGPYDKGFTITGVEDAEEISGVVVFHAGTRMSGNILVTSGGRVLGVTAVSKTLDDALDTAYKAVRLISFQGFHYRTDIGAKSLALARKARSLEPIQS